MAYIEFNALSTILCGSFSAKIFLPEMSGMYLDDEKHQKKYPVLWLLHSEGGTALDWLTTPAEQCAVRHGIVIIAPDVQHSLGTNMVYGPKFEQFMADEFPKICRNNLPLAEEAGRNWIGGTGTGAYGALKIAMKHPEVFSKAISLDGILDMAAICDKAQKNEETGIYHNKESLEAVFDELSKVGGSSNDLYALAKQVKEGQYYFGCTSGSKYLEESTRLAKILGDCAVMRVSDAEADFSCFAVMPQAVEWVCKKEGEEIG